MFAWILYVVPRMLQTILIPLEEASFTFTESYLKVIMLMFFINCNSKLSASSLTIFQPGFVLKKLKY